MNIKFLNTQDVLILYKKVMSRYGGSYGIRDINLLDSAISQAKMLYQYEDCDIFQIAAVYFYHIIKNHPFVDGNKRTGLLATITFLEINNIKVNCDFDSLYQMTISVADSTCTKEEIAKFFSEIQKVN